MPRAASARAYWPIGADDKTLPMSGCDQPLPFPKCDRKRTLQPVLKALERAFAGFSVIELKEIDTSRSHIDILRATIFALDAPALIVIPASGVRSQGFQP
jgi:hypothetical protein